MLKIIHITDLHLLGDESGKIYGLNPFISFQKIAEAIGKIKDADCVIITGDIANNGEYQAYIQVNELLVNIKIPILWLQGNHDISEVMLQVAPKIKIMSDKSFLIKDTKVILLHSVMRDEDNLSRNKGRGYLFDYEMSFLKSELEENNFNHCIIGLHHPPVLSNSWADRRILDNRDEFINLIEHYPKVKLVIYGHQHITQHTIINGINYISSPPTSFHYDPNGEKFSLLEKGPGFGIISIYDDGAVKLDEYVV